MKRLKNWFMRKVLVKAFAESSTSTFSGKVASEITLFDALGHYSK